MRKINIFLTHGPTMRAQMHTLCTQLHSPGDDDISFQQTIVFLTYVGRNVSILTKRN